MAGDLAVLSEWNKTLIARFDGGALTELRSKLDGRMLVHVPEPPGSAPQLEYAGGEAVCVLSELARRVTALGLMVALTVAGAFRASASVGVVHFGENRGTMVAPSVGLLQPAGGVRRVLVFHADLLVEVKHCQ